MMRNIMKRAHELAKTMEGDYSARMSLALRQAWEEAKKVSDKVVRYNTISVQQCKELYGKTPSEIKGVYFVNLGETWALPELQGTEKQVDWANSLRAKVLSQAKHKFSRLQMEGDVERLKNVANTLEESLNIHIDAKFWIDNRDRI